MPPENEVDVVETIAAAPAEAATGAKTEGQPAEPAPSPGAGDEADKPTSSIVRDVLAKAAEKAKAASSAAGEAKADKPADGDPKTTEKGPDDYSDVPFHQHPRFQQVIKAKNTAETRVKELEPAAERYQNVQKYLAENGLSAKEVGDTLSILAQAKVDPGGAWKRLEPMVRKLITDAGEVLPEDLAKRVQDGELTPDAAKEVSRARAAEKSYQLRRDHEVEQQARRDRQAVFEAIGTAVHDWFADRTAKDPNFTAKVPLVRARLAEIHAEKGQGKTPDEAKEQLVEAYKWANSHYVAPAPNPPPPANGKPAMTPITGGAAIVKDAPAAELTTLDVIRQKVAAQQGRR